MWESFEHPRCVEIPHWCPAHHVDPQWPEDSEIHGGIDLFHESILLRAGLNAVVDRHWPNESLHEEFASE